MADWGSLDKAYLMSTYNRLPIAIARGEGNRLYDTEGNAYLDLFTGLAVNLLGHSHPKVLRALHEQADRFLHISNLFYNPPAITLAKRLVEQSIGGKVFFCNSGAEATEAMIKLVHKWIAASGDGRDGIVVLKNSFHGRTLGALKLTRQPHVRQDFPQPAFNVIEVERENVAQLRDVCERHRPAAVLLEPVLGSGGVIALSEPYLRETAALCRTYGMLCCMDEIQTGIGRTGRFFAYQHAGIEPDLVLFAKGIGGGLPLGGIIAGEKLADLFRPGDHGTTFGPSPLSAALGNAVLDVLLDDGQLERGREAAEALWERLRALQRKHPRIAEIRGKGMMIGLCLDAAADEVSALQRRLLADGILVDVTQKTIVRLLPPLTLTMEEIDRFAAALDRHIAQLDS